MDNGLPLGGRSCAGIFNYLLDVAKWIFKKVYEAPHLCYLLDDFLHKMVHRFEKGRPLKKVNMFSVYYEFLWTDWPLLLKTSKNS